MAKKNVQRGLNNIIVVCNTKGGEGKSMVSIQKLPLLFIDKNIFIFEVDNNNNSKKLIDNSEKIKFKTFPTITISTVKILNTPSTFGITNIEHKISKNCTITYIIILFFIR